MYPTLTQAAADDHRTALVAEATRRQLLRVLRCCSSRWHRTTAWLRDLARSTQIGPGYLPPSQDTPATSYFRPCCA